MAGPGVSLEAGAPRARGPRTRGPRVVPARCGAASGKPRLGWARPGGPRRLLPGLRNGSSQQPKFCLVPHGASSLTAAWPVTTETSCLSLKGNKHKHTHARNLSAAADGCVPGFVAQSPASPSGGFGGCQLWGRECV